jgi:hypothetical protein
MSALTTLVQRLNELDAVELHAPGKHNQLDHGVGARKRAAIKRARVSGSGGSGAASSQSSGPAKKKLVEPHTVTHTYHSSNSPESHAIAEKDRRDHRAAVLKGRAGKKDPNNLTPEERKAVNDFFAGHEKRKADDKKALADFFAKHVTNSRKKPATPKATPKTASKAPPKAGVINFKTAYANAANNATALMDKNKKPYKRRVATK